MSAMIPHRERGYAVERVTSVVHERYQDHAPRAVRTSELGMRAMTAGAAVPCPVCFPPPRPEPVRRWRSKQADAEVVAAPEPAAGVSTAGGQLVSADVMAEIEAEDLS